MENVKYKTFKGFSVSIFALAMVACGGGGDDSNKVSATPASLTTATDIAKAVAGVQAAKTIFDVVINNSVDTIEEVITEGKAEKDISCGTSPSAGKFRVTTNTGTAYTKDGTGVSTMCLESGEKFDGTLSYQCNDATKCENNTSLVASNLVWGDTNKAIELKVNGSSSWFIKDTMPTDEYRGSVTITKGASSTTFSTYDRLVTQYFKKNQIVGYGGMTVSSGSATNCVEGAYAYSIKNSLIMNSGTQRITGGLIRISSGGNSEGPEAGSVTFKSDGGITVKLPNGIETNFSKTEFESYCGLKEAYDFSEK